jgi:hypothetical protein
MKQLADRLSLAVLTERPEAFLSGKTTVPATARIDGVGITEDTLTRRGGVLLLPTKSLNSGKRTLFAIDNDSDGFFPSSILAMASRIGASG